MAELKGTFYGVSVGPGDPELMTLQAVRLIRQCPVLAVIRLRWRLRTKKPPPRCGSIWMPGRTLPC